MIIFLSILLYAAWLFFAFKRLLTYTHALQQEEYDNRRLLRWMAHYMVFDKRMTIALLLILPVAFFFPVGWRLPAALCFFAFAWLEKDPRRDAKKKLVFTMRVQRVFFTAFALLTIIGIVCLVPGPWAWILAVQAVPFVLILANLLLFPVEEKVQKKYWNEAHARITALAPKTIAITGSFGKTSVKHILGHILKSQAPTLITPGSVNTPMGIARIIRENLDESHKYFIAEMGAYGPGSVARLCALAPPDTGIITAIGHAHYERFKSLDTVAQAKFELAEAVIARQGQVVIHEDVLRFDHAKKMKDAHPDNFIVCGQDFRIGKIEQRESGLTVDIEWNGNVYSLEMPLFGLHHGRNAALAFAAAAALGVDSEAIRISLRSVPQIAHRLEVKHQSDGTVLIDDAYNSNPAGFKAALEALAVLKGSGRGILVTPGMVELGAAHDEEHREIGALAGQICDIAVAIRPERIRTFVNAFTESKKPLYEVRTFQEAAEWLEKHKQRGDVILIENDLPDIYERIPRI